MLPPGASAAPEEIQVYVDELTEPGHIGLDVHNNYGVTASRTPGYPGERPPQGVYRMTPEFYYGLSSNVELGFYLLTARDADGRFHVDGQKARLKYVAPHDEKNGFFWGVNLEVGKSNLAVAPQPWNYEFKTIAGDRRGPWLLAFNINVDAALSARAGPTTVQLAGRLMRGLGGRTQVGIESYNDLGPTRHVGSLSNQDQRLFLVVDTEMRSVDLSAGIGRGLTGVADHWVLKAIVGFHF